MSKDVFINGKHANQISPVKLLDDSVDSVTELFTVLN